MNANPYRYLFRAQTYRTLLYLATAVPVAALVLGLLIAGGVGIPLLAITPLVVPALLTYRTVSGVLARADARLARALLGVDVRPRITSGGPGFWGRAKAVLVDPAFWKQQAFLAVRMTLGFAIAVGELAVLGGSLYWMAEPIVYRWNDESFGSWHVDTLGRAFVFVPAGLVCFGIGLFLIRPLGALSIWLVRTLLDESGGPVRARWSREARRRALAVHAGTAGFVVVVVTAVWALTTQGYFWPEWVALPLALAVAVHAWVKLVAGRIRSLGLDLHLGVAAALGGFLVLVWAVTTRGYFWPEWPLAAFALTFGLHAWFELTGQREELLRRKGLSRAFGLHAGVWLGVFLFETFIWAVTDRGYFWPGWLLLGAAVALVVHAVVDRGAEQRQLSRRVETLETTRAGAVEEQDAELQRIERNLHDGAQARLVALGMSLGMAEQKFQTDPEGARQLLVEARSGVAEALRELRDLARGVYPPVLSDRGLEAALASLADRSPIQVTVDVAVEDRPGAQVEAAAYFVAAEALANAVKHSGARHVTIGVVRDADTLTVEVRDDGQGGADPSGSGLVGLRRRVEALDGALAVTSPAGGPTVVRAELPCGS